MSKQQKLQLRQMPVKLAQWSSKHPKAVMWIAACLTILGLVFALRLELHNDVVELLPEDLPEVKTIRKMIKETEGLGYQAVVASSPDKHKNRAFLKQVKTKLEGLYHEPDLPAQTYAQKLHERIAQTYEGIFRHAKNPNAHSKKSLETRIANIHKTPFINYALMGFKKDFFKEHGLLYLDNKDLKTVHKRLKAKIKFEVRKNQPGYIDLLGEKDPGLNLKDIEKKYRKKGKNIVAPPERLEVKEGNIYYTALLFRPRGTPTDITYSRMLMDRVDSILKTTDTKKFHASMQLSYMGRYSANVREYFAVLKDTTASFGLTFILLCTLLWVFFRRWRVLLLIPVPLIIGTIWTFAFAYLWIGYLTTATGFIGALILGMGIDYGIYLLDRYLQERKEGASIAKAIENCYRWTGKAVSTAALTTAAAFFALLLCRFTGFSQFGGIGGMGILFCLFAMHSVLPAMLVLMEKKRPFREVQPFFKMPTVSPKKPFPFAVGLVALSFILLGSSFLSMPRVTLETNLRKLGVVETDPMYSDNVWKKFDKLFSESQLNPIVFYVEKERDARLLSKEIERRSKEHHKTSKRSKKLIETVIHPFMMVPDKQKEKLATIQKIKSLIDKNDVLNLIEDPKRKEQFSTFNKMLSVNTFGIRELPHYLQRDLILTNKNNPSETKGFLVAVVSNIENEGVDNQKISALLKNISIEGKTYFPSGEPVIAGELMRVVKKDSLLAIFASLLTLALLVFIDLRSFKLTLLSLWPLLMGFSAMAGIMVFIDLKLNIINMVVLPALLGIGIDGGVHVLHRYRERPDLGVSGVIMELLLPVTIASVTTVFSFATMLSASHKGVFSAGLVAVIGLVSCLVGALLLLPAMMNVIFHRFPIQPSSPDKSEVRPPSRNRNTTPKPQNPFISSPSPDKNFAR